MRRNADAGLSPRHALLLDWPKARAAYRRRPHTARWLLLSDTRGAAAIYTPSPHLSSTARVLCSFWHVQGIARVASPPMLRILGLDREQCVARMHDDVPHASPAAWCALWRTMGGSRARRHAACPRPAAVQTSRDEDLALCRDHRSTPVVRVKITWRTDLGSAWSMATRKVWPLAT